MQNEKGENVELYMPRRWYVNSGDAITYSDWTNRVIDAQDHASVMINIARLDPKTGVATGEYDTISLGGYIRSKGEADNAFTTLAKDL